MNKYYNKVKLFVKKYVFDRKVELLRYLIVGIVGVVIDFLVFALLIKADVSQIVAQWLASLAGATHNHLWQHFYIFSHNQKLSRTYFWGMLVSVASILVSGPLLVFFNKWIANVWLSKLCVIALVTFLLYIIRRRWIFIYREEKK